MPIAISCGPRPGVGKIGKSSLRATRSAIYTIITWSIVASFAGLTWPTFLEKFSSHRDVLGGVKLYDLIIDKFWSSFDVYLDVFLDVKSNWRHVEKLFFSTQSPLDHFLVTFEPGLVTKSIASVCNLTHSLRYFQVVTTWVVMCTDKLLL